MKTGRLGEEERRRPRQPKVDDCVVWLVMIFATIAGAMGASFVWAIFEAWRRSL